MISRAVVQSAGQRREDVALAMPSRERYVYCVLRTMIRVLIVFAFVIATGVPGFARVMPMMHSAAVPMAPAVANVSLCVGGDCPGHHEPGRAHHRSMGARCIASACTYGAAVVGAGAGTVAFIRTTITYSPPAVSFLIGRSLVPDAPPPRSFALS